MTSLADFDMDAVVRAAKQKEEAKRRRLFLESLHSRHLSSRAPSDPRTALRSSAPSLRNSPKYSSRATYACGGALDRMASDKVAGSFEALAIT